MGFSFLFSMRGDELPWGWQPAHAKLRCLSAADGITFIGTESTRAAYVASTLSTKGQRSRIGHDVWGRTYASLDGIDAPAGTSRDVLP